MTSLPERLPLLFRAAVAAAFLVILAAPAASGITESQERGKRIYREGKGRHRITAFLLGAGIKAPGAAFPCIHCHLAEGSGQSEGGVRSADITWHNLSKTQGGVRPSGRSHPPYDEESLATAVLSGQDPAGNELDKAHPRFEMDAEDVKDLVAYLKIMDREPVPGVTDNEVRVAILLPEEGALAEAGREAEGLLSGYFAEVNARGGIYNRYLVLVPARYGAAGDADPRTAARRLVERDDAFCFLANIAAGPEDGLARYLAERRVPVLAPLVSPPDTGYGADRYTFHIFSGISDQARVMADFVAERLRDREGRVGILFASDRHGEAGAEGTRAQMKKHGIGISVELPFPQGSFSARDAVDRMRREKIDALLYFGGSREAISLAEEAEKRGWRPLFVAPAQMVGEALRHAPQGFLAAAYFATPLAPPDASSRKMEDFLRLARKYGLKGKHPAFQFLAYSGAVLLEEGLKRSGRGVTRDRFVDSIGNVWRMETGVTPPLTYDPNRRSGAIGAAIFKVDPATGKNVPVVPWREPR